MDLDTLKNLRMEENRCPQCGRPTSETPNEACWRCRFMTKWTKAEEVAASLYNEKKLTQEEAVALIVYLLDVWQSGANPAEVQEKVDWLAFYGGLKMAESLIQAIIWNQSVALKHADRIPNLE